MSESAVLCEGYYDRAFWAGLLVHLGCVDRGRGPHGRYPVFDPDGREVTAPEFGFHSRTGAFVRIVACEGKQKVVREARNRLREEAQRIGQQEVPEPRLVRLVLSMDSDMAVEEPSPKTGSAIMNLNSWLWQFDQSAETAEDGGGILVFGCKTKVSLVCWEAGSDISTGVPTLERLVCSAIVAAYPERGEPVQRWLESRPNAPEAGPKEFAWSHMAGWYAKDGPAAFYKKLWKAKRLAAELRSRLEACGAWQLAEELAK